jgi:uncharacterized protein (DUF3084 family)
MTTTPAAEHNFTALDDDQLISQRAALRARLERLPQHARKRAALAQQYDALTGEFDRRARAAWQPAEVQPGSTRQRVEIDSAGQRP